MKMNKLAVLTAVVLLTSTEAKEKCGATKKKKCLKNEGCTWSKSDGCVVCDDCVDRPPKGDWVTNDEHQQFQETVYTHLGDFYANLHCGCSAVSLEDPEHRPNCSRITDRENCSLLIQKGQPICRWIDEDENECLVSKFQDLSSRMEYLAEQSSQLKQESRDKDIIIAELREKVDQSLTTGLQNQDDISGHAAEAEADRNAIKIAHDALAATVADNKVSNNEKFAAAEEQRNAIRQEAAQALTDGLAEADEAMTSAFAETEADRNDKHGMVMERIESVEGDNDARFGSLVSGGELYVSKEEAQAAKTEATKQVEEQVAALQERIDEVDGSCEKRRDADDFYALLTRQIRQKQDTKDKIESSDEFTVGNLPDLWKELEGVYRVTGDQVNDKRIFCHTNPERNMSFHACIFYHLVEGTGVWAITTGEYDRMSGLVAILISPSWKYSDNGQWFHFEGGTIHSYKLSQVESLRTELTAELTAEFDRKLGGYARTSHSHSNYATKSQADRDYAPMNHSHSQYTTKSQADRDYAPMSHSHSQYATKSQSDRDYAPKTHSHSQYVTTSTFSGHTHQYVTNTHLSAVNQKFSTSEPATCTRVEIGSYRDGGSFGGGKLEKC